MEVTLYETRSQPPTAVTVDIAALVRHIRAAAYRFWVSERRMPAAVVVPLQLAQAMTNSVGAPLSGELRCFGSFALDDLAEVPIIARDAFLDPLFQFI